MKPIITVSYASSLPGDEFVDLYEQLYQKSKEHAEAAYQVMLAKAQTSEQIKSCAGVYSSDWSELFRLWVGDKAGNLYIRECLKNGIVPSIDANGSQRALGEELTSEVAAHAMLNVVENEADKPISSAHSQSETPDGDQDQPTVVQALRVMFDSIRDYSSNENAYARDDTSFSLVSIERLILKLESEAIC